jgi:hypothetical protein
MAFVESHNNRRASDLDIVSGNVTIEVILLDNMQCIIGDIYIYIFNYYTIALFGVHTLHFPYNNIDHLAVDVFYPIRLCCIIYNIKIHICYNQDKI